ncbi:hypothetical protein PGH43_00215 [Legionella pneumophila 130b]|nr:hypothetical protein PGH43_00215 [Legionella pneumophila 130b]
MPNGVAFHKGALYVAEIGRILRFDNIESNLNNPPEPVVVTTKLPKEKAHGWRFISFGPDDKLYIGIGAPCNVCLMEDPRYATIMRMNTYGQDLRSMLEEYVIQWGLIGIPFIIIFGLQTMGVTG